VKMFAQRGQIFRRTDFHAVGYIKHQYAKTPRF
jgi:hypothetical protein